MEFTKAEKAEKMFRDGYNCSQAVFCAFAEDLGMNKEMALKLSSSFGGGMGRLREVCGAVSGMFMAAGMIFGYSDPKDKTSKTAHYKLIQELAGRVKEKYGTIICRELLPPSARNTNPVPDDRTAQYYTKRSCAELVHDCAEILENYIEDAKEKSII